MITCQCPAGDTIATIPSVTCAERFGQIQKIIFQRIWNSKADPVVKNSIDEDTVTAQTPAGDATLLASWTALKTVSSATDYDKKIAVTPFIEEPTDDGGDARTVGGGNASLNGIETVIGSNPVNFSCKLNNVPQDVVAAIRLLMCECMGNNLGVYLVNENGQIQGLRTAGATSGHYSWSPIPIQKLFVSDLKHGNLEGNDYNDLQFAFAPGYSDNLDILTLDKSALTL